MTGAQTRYDRPVALRLVLGTLVRVSCAPCAGPSTSPTRRAARPNHASWWDIRRSARCSHASSYGRRPSSSASPSSAAIAGRRFRCAAAGRPRRAAPCTTRSRWAARRDHPGPRRPSSRAPKPAQAAAPWSRTPVVPVAIRGTRDWRPGRARSASRPAAVRAAGGLGRPTARRPTSSLARSARCTSRRYERLRAAWGRGRGQVPERGQVDAREPAHLVAARRRTSAPRSPATATRWPATGGHASS